jgi:hypothetical protein
MPKMTSDAEDALSKERASSGIEVIFEGASNARHAWRRSEERSDDPRFVLG